MGGGSVFIVKRSSDLIRFGVFVVLVAALVWFVVGRFSTWRAAEVTQEPPVEPPLAMEPGPVEPVIALDPPAVEPAAAEEGDGQDYFAEYRINRERNRGALGDRLKEVMASSTADPDVQKAAAQQYLELGQVADMESRAEAMVKARGFEDVIVHLARDSAQVVVKAADLDQHQVVQIIDTVSKITGVKGTAVTVLAKDR